MTDSVEIPTVTVYMYSLRIYSYCTNEFLPLYMYIPNNIAQSCGNVNIADVFNGYTVLT